MPNYRYNTSDCTRRGQSGCSRQPAAASVPPMPSKPACCDDRAEYDELNGLPIAMAYVPWQQWRAIYVRSTPLAATAQFMKWKKDSTGVRYSKN